MLLCRLVIRVAQDVQSGCNGLLVRLLFGDEVNLGPRSSQVPVVVWLREIVNVWTETNWTQSARHVIGSKNHIHALDQFLFIRQLVTFAYKPSPQSKGIFGLGQRPEILFNHIIELGDITVLCKAKYSIGFNSPVLPPDNSRVQL